MTVERPSPALRLNDYRTGPCPFPTAGCNGGCAEPVLCAVDRLAKALGNGVVVIDTVRGYHSWPYEGGAS